MIRDYVKKYYLEQNRNCAESVLLAANEALGFSLREEDAKLIAGFGGGLGCGSLCGALAGAVAILGRALVAEKAHTTSGFRETCASLKKDFEKRLGSILCADLKPKYFNEENRCLATVLLASDVLEDILRSNGVTSVERANETRQKTLQETPQR